MKKAKAKQKILETYDSCASCRIEGYSIPDARGRVHYAAFWITHYHPGHPEDKCATRERGQHFFGVPPDKFKPANKR